MKFIWFKDGEKQNINIWAGMQDGKDAVEKEKFAFNRTSRGKATKQIRIHQIG